MTTTFTVNDYARRMRRAADAAAGKGLAGLLITPGPDLRYLCGYRPTAITERFTVLIVPVTGEPVMIVPRLERADAESAAGAASLRIVDWTDGVDPFALVTGELRAESRYAISDSAWSLHLLGLRRSRPDLRFAAITDVLPMLRAVKDGPELDRMAAAAAAADATFQEILTAPFAGRTEDEVAGRLAELLRQHGHSQVDFTIVGSGPNGANPHHEAGDRVIGPGDMVVLDFGGLLGGYGSDTTRTVHVGEPTAEELQVFEVVRRAQQAGFEAVRPGVACQQVDRAARRVIEQAGYGEFFIHRTGHGIGLTTHEPPYLIEGEEQELVPGMCFSIEPGIYLPGRFGVRIEDIVVCTDSGGRRLNTTTHEMQIVS